MIFSSFLLREPFGLIEISAAVCSFIGVVLVSNPHLRLDFVSGHAPGYALGCFVSLVDAVISALTCCLVRAFSADVHFMMFVLAMGVGVFVPGVLMGGVSLSAMTADAAMLRLVVLACFCGLFGTTCLHKAFSYCRAGTGSLLRTVDVPFSYILGVLVLNEIPQVLSLVGSALIIAGICMVALQRAPSENAEKGMEACSTQDTNV